MFQLLQTRPNRFVLYFSIPHYLNHLNKLRIKTNLPKLMFEAHLATNITSSDYLEVNFAMFEASLELCFRLT